MINYLYDLNPHERASAQASAMQAMKCGIQDDEYGKLRAASATIEALFTWDASTFTTRYTIARELTTWLTEESGGRTDFRIASEHAEQLVGLFGSRPEYILPLMGFYKRIEGAWVNHKRSYEPYRVTTLPDGDWIRGID